MATTQYPPDYTGGPAFPCGQSGGTFTADDGHTYRQFEASHGMTMRDWFAGQALQGLTNLAGRDPDAEAALAYRYADAMLRIRDYPVKPANLDRQ